MSTVAASDELHSRFGPPTRSFTHLRAVRSFIMRSLLSAFLLVPATTFAASIHVTRDLVPASNLPAGWQYAGCGVDTVIPRTLNKASTHAKDLTAGTCIAFCSSKGYNTAGSEYGGECYCGWTLPLPANESDCSMPCKGDATQACGGRARLSVYQNPTLTAPKANPGVDGWISYGCLADSQQNRTLPNLKPVGGPMTVALCIAGCKAAGYGFGGVEVSEQLRILVAMTNNVGSVRSRVLVWQLARR